MNRLLSFISSYEEELVLQLEFIDKSVKRLKKQIRDTNLSVKEAENSIDTSYSIFSASQSNNETDTAISTMNQIITDKNKQIEDLEIKKTEILTRLNEIKSINDDIMAADVMRGISDRLNQIKKYIGVDNHRARTEIDILIKKITDAEDK